jgi:lipopolysaccharide exporter
MTVRARVTGESEGVEQEEQAGPRPDAPVDDRGSARQAGLHPDPPADSGAGADGDLAKKAVRGAFWTILTGNGARVIGLVGTVLITRFLDPEDYGLASLAAIVIMTANTVSNCGLSQYIVSKPKAGRAAAFHASFYFLLLGVVALGVTLLASGPIARFVNAQGIERYLPGLAVAALLERIGTIQDRILVRDMRFFSVGIQRAVGEIAYSVVSVGLAALCARDSAFGGANALVWGSIARSVLRFITLSASTPRAEWLEPCKITWQHTKDLFAFGLPMSVATLFAFGSRKWDNVVFSRQFGPTESGIYNYSYQLADIPATQIGENIGDVLVPSFAQMESEERRKKALLVSMRMLTLIVAPLAVGLAAVAQPVVHAFFDPRWYGIAAMMPVLSALSVVRPIGWIGSSYLQVKDRPRAIMILEGVKTFGLLALMVAIGRITAGMPGSTLWVCGAVGIAFALNSLSYMWVIRSIDGLSLREQIVPLLPPVLACIPMALAVLGVRSGLASLWPLPPVGAPGFRAREGVELAVEVLVGGVVFVPSAFFLAPSASREFVRLLRTAIDKRRKRAPADAAPAAALE